MIFSVILKARSGDNLTLWLDWFLRWYQLPDLSQAFASPLTCSSGVASFALNFAKQSLYVTSLIFFNTSFYLLFSGLVSYLGICNPS